MSRALSLHHVTAMELSPPDLVSLASELGLRHVCLFTCIAPEAAEMFPVDWSARIVRETKARCVDLGVKAHNLEWFDVTEADQRDFHMRGLELGRSLGARTATTHVLVADPSEAADRFGEFCDLAAQFDIAACIEFTPIIGTPDLATTIPLIERAARPNGGIALDALHLLRSGGSVADIAALDPRHIRSAQISDGPMQKPDMAAYVDETVYERMIPGEGEFPLRELLAHVPADVIIDVEVPLRGHQQRGLGPSERARLAVDGARRVLQGVDV